jgi:hypothetical protein
MTPLAGESEVMVGALAYVYASLVVLEESTFVATKLTAPAGLAGVVMVADKPS